MHPGPHCTHRMHTWTLQQPWERLISRHPCLPCYGLSGYRPQRRITLEPSHGDPCRGLSALSLDRLQTIIPQLPSGGTVLSSHSEHCQGTKALPTSLLTLFAVGLATACPYSAACALQRNAGAHQCLTSDSGKSTVLPVAVHTSPGHVSVTSHVMGLQNAL
jgi:hypothetical protein